MIEMTSNKSYLIYAYYDWISDNLLTPYIVVDTSCSGVVVPEQYIQDDRITLNILSSVIHGLLIDIDGMSFKTRFNGASVDIMLPIDSIMAIYAHEYSGAGLAFSSLEVDEPVFESKNEQLPDVQVDQERNNTTEKRSHLRVVK